MAVVKDEAYGHGALDVARIALEEGAWGFGLSTLEEAMTLRDAGITAPLLLLGERQEAELEWCVAHDLTVCVNEPHTVRKLAQDRGEVRQTGSGSRQNPHRHEPLRRALGRGAAAHRTNCRRKIIVARRRDDAFLAIG